MGYGTIIVGATVDMCVVKILLIFENVDNFGNKLVYHVAGWLKFLLLYKTFDCLLWNYIIILR